MNWGAHFAITGSSRGKRSIDVIVWDGIWSTGFIAGLDANSPSIVIIVASLDKIPNMVGEFVIRRPKKYVCESIWKWIFEDWDAAIVELYGVVGWMGIWLETGTSVIDTTRMGLASAYC